MGHVTFWDAPSGKPLARYGGDCTRCKGTGEISEDHGSTDRGARVSVITCPSCGGWKRTRRTA